MFYISIWYVYKQNFGSLIFCRLARIYMIYVKPSPDFARIEFRSVAWNVSSHDVM